MTAEDATDRLRVRCGDRSDVEAELEAGSSPRHPHDTVTEAFSGVLLAIGRGRERDARVGVQMVDVCLGDKAVHCGVDGWGSAAETVAAVVERSDHLIFALDPWVHRGEGP